MEKTNAQKIFEKWKSEVSLLKKDRASSESNLAYLFETFKENQVSFEEANSFIKLAINCYTPSKSVIKNTYKNLGRNNKSEEDFANDWKQSIEDRVNQAFFTFYPMEDIKTPEKKEGPSKQEMIILKDYAESFPEIDVDKEKDPAFTIKEMVEEFKKMGINIEELI